jgi:hypothetical protein
VARPAGGRPPAKRTRQRAGFRSRARRAAGLRHPWLLLLIVLGIVSLGVLAVGLATISLTIFSVGKAGPAPKHPSSTHSPTQALSDLVGRPIDGTVVAVSVDTNVIAIQPDTGNPVQADVNASSKITKSGAATTLASLIPGDAVIVTFTQTPSGALLVAQLRDIVSLPTNAPAPTPTPYPTFAPYPLPTASGPFPAPGLPTPNPGGPPVPGSRATPTP